VVYLYAVIVDEMIKNGLHVVYLYAVIVDEMIKNRLDVVYLWTWSTCTLSSSTR